MRKIHIHYKNMKIGIDASRYIVDEKTGVEYYSAEIINGIVDLILEKDKHEVILYTPKFIEKFEKLKRKITQKVIPFPKFWTQIRLSWELKTNPVDILFIPSHTIPIIHPKKTVVTIHDTAYRYFRSAYTRQQYYYLDWSTRFAVKQAAKIIVPSEATKKDLIGFYHCDPEKIEVIYHGIAEKIEFKINEKEKKEILNKFGLTEGDNYMLFIGRLESKKNLERVVKAFADFSKKHEGWKLILAGKRGVGFKQIWDTVSRLECKNNILMPGYIDEKEKQVLLKEARLFVFVSLYEGFGFPLFEAFLSKVPVLSSSQAALREIGFEAAYLVNPLDVEDITTAMEKIVFDENLKDQLIQKGLDRTKEFSWQKSVKATLKVLENL